MMRLRTGVFVVLIACLSFIFSGISRAEDPSPAATSTPEASQAESSPVAETSVPAGEEQIAEEVVVEEAPVSRPGNVSLDFKDADINNVLRILSLKSKVNIVTGPEVQGTVTIRLEDVPWEKALDVVLRTYGYVYERKENIIRVTTKENLSTEELMTETFVLNYTTSAEAEVAVRDILSERGRIKSVPRTNMLVVTDIPTNLHKIREVVERLDKSTPQAYIDSKIVKTQLQEGENLGITWAPSATLTGSQRPVSFPFDASARETESNSANIWGRMFAPFFPGVSTGTDPIRNPNDTRGFPFTPVELAEASNTFSYGKLDFTGFQAALQFLRTRNNTKIISNPRITVLNNQPAKIKVGTDVALPTFERNENTGSFEISGYTYRETGVVMEVTPHINDANEILVDLKPEVSSQSGATQFASAQNNTASFTSIPNFAVTTASTQVLIRSGETIAIGGLLTDAYNAAETKVPVLGDLPFAGKLFRSKARASGDNNSKVETLFFVTVNIIDTAGQPTILTVPQAANPVNQPVGGPAVNQGIDPAVQKLPN